MDVGKKHSYLGMQICLEDGYVTVDMIHYIEKMLESVTNLEESSVLANKNIFVVDEKSPLLPVLEHKRFHTLVAKLLFLSKRARPEISTSNGFLCTRVTKATAEDKLKLFRLLGFLKHTKGRGLKLHPKDLTLLDYIDAYGSCFPSGWGIDFYCVAEIEVLDQVAYGERTCCIDRLHWTRGIFYRVYWFHYQHTCADFCHFSGFYLSYLFGDKRWWNCQDQAPPRSDEFV